MIPGAKIRDPQVCWMGQNKLHLERKRLGKYTDHFGASSKKRRRHQKRKETSISERIPRVIIHIGHG